MNQSKLQFNALMAFDVSSEAISHNDTHLIIHVNFPFDRYEHT